MFLLCYYDIADSPEILRKVAQICKNYGVRVQKSVFELDVSMADLIKMQAELQTVINKDCDSVRFYRLGKNFRDHVQILGMREIVELSKDDALIF